MVKEHFTYTTSMSPFVYRYRIDCFWRPPSTAENSIHVFPSQDYPVIFSETIPGPHEVIKTYYYKNSVSTPGWNSRHGKSRSKYVRRTINPETYLREPTVPRYMPPKLTSRPEPKLKLRVYVDKKFPLPAAEVIRRQKLSDLDYKRYRKAYLEWRAYEHRRKLKLESYRQRFLSTTLKYNKRMDLLRVRKAKYAQHKALVKRFPGSASIEVDNPYEEITLINKGTSPLTAVRTWDATAWPGTAVFIRPMSETSLLVPSSAQLFASGVRQLLVRVEDSMESKLSQKFWDKVSNQKVHYANMIAERAQTMNLLASSVKRLAALIQGKKSLLKNLTRYASNPKLIANDFLAFKFGVEPLVSDIKGTAEHLAQLSLDTANPTVIAIRTNTTKVINEMFNGIHVKGIVTISYVIKYDVTDDAVRALQTLGGLNPLEVAWEVTPWSFVVDWVIPIGAYLNQLSADCGLSFRTGTRSITYQLDCSGGALPADPLASLETTYVIGDFFMKAKFRTVLTEPPPKLQLTIKSPFSWTHSLESLALLVQRTRKS